MTARSAKAKTGNGATIAFDGSDFNTINSAKIVTVSAMSRSIEALDWSDLSTTNQVQLIPADLYTVDPLDIEWRWDANEYDANSFTPMAGATANITITHPLWAATTGTGGMITGSGFWVNDTTPQLSNNEVGVGSMQWQFDGVTEIAFTAEDTV